MNSSLITDDWSNGCSGEERIGDNHWRWCDKNSSLIIRNYSKVQRSVTIKFKIKSGYKDYSKLQISSPFFSDIFKINNDNLVYEKLLSIKPGKKYTINISTDSPRLNAYGDPRSLFLMISDFQMTSTK